MELKGDLDLSAYREVKPEHILIDNSGDRTIMNETNFAKMMAKIGTQSVLPRSNVQRTIYHCRI